MDGFHRRSGEAWGDRGSPRISKAAARRL